MLGIRPDFDKLIIDPCVPKDWEKFSVVRKWRGATYNINIYNPDKVMKGVKSIKVNGNELDYIPVMEENSVNEIEIIMG